MKESPDQILNTFETLDNDVINELSTNRTYEMALNMVRKSGWKKKFGLANEGSTERILTLPSEVIGNVYVEDRNWYIFLFKNADIGYFDMEEENYVRIGSLNGLRNDTNDKCTGLPTGLNIGCDFDFSKCEWVNIEYNYWNQCNELHIAFSNNCEFYTDLYDEDYNLVVQSTTTNANGEYSFVVPAGSYYIYPSVSGYAYTLENQGSDETVDSDFDTSDTFGFITVLQDQKLKYDIGFYRVADYSVESTRTIEIHGATPVEKVITISELNGISNSNITFYTFASNRLTINWNPSLITMDSQLVNNLDWHYDGLIENNHIWTYQGNGGVFPPNGVSKIGINYTYDPLGSSGHTSIGFYLVQNHLEENYSNNAAIDIINFFGA